MKVIIHCVFLLFCLVGFSGCSSFSWKWLLPTYWFSNTPKEILEEKKHWSITVLSVNKEELNLDILATPPYLEFDGKFHKLSGLIGCNPFSASYQIDGELLETSRVDIGNDVCYPLSFLDLENALVDGISQTNLEITQEGEKIILQKDNFSIHLQ